MAYIQLLTDLGRNAIAQAETGLVMTFTRLALSEQVVDPDDIPALETLASVVMNTGIAGVVNDRLGQATITSRVQLAEVPREFQLWAIGVYCQIQTHEEILYGVCAAEPELGVDTIRPASPGSVTEHTFRIATTIGNTEHVTAIFDPDVDIVNIGPPESGAGPFSFRLGHTFNLKRLTNGPGISVTETPDIIRIGQTIAEVDLDLYVPLTHPEGTPATRFPTIQDALHYLDDVTIPTERIARIHVYQGVYTITEQIIVRHPHGDQIEILGSDYPEVQVSSVGVATGGPGNWIYTVTLSDATNFAVGDWAALHSFTGGGTIGNLQITMGAWEITAKTGNVITVRNLFPRSPITTGGGYWVVNAGRAKPLKTIIRCNSCNGFSIIGKGLGLLKNFMLVGNATDNYGIIVGGLNAYAEEFFPTVCEVDYCGANNFGAMTGIGPSGFYAVGAGAILNVIRGFAGGNYQGFGGYFGALINVSQRAVANSNRGYGFQVVSADMSLRNAVACGNVYGIVGYAGARVRVVDGWANENGSNGLIIRGGSHGLFTRTMSRWNGPNGIANALANLMSCIELYTSDIPTGSHDPIPGNFNAGRSSIITVG